MGGDSNLIKVEQGEGTTVTATTTETSMFGVEFPGNFWQPGKVVRIEASAHVVSQHSTDTWHPRGRFGTDGTTPANNEQASGGSATDAGDDHVAALALTAVCRDVGDGTVKVIWQGYSNDFEASYGTSVRHAHLESAAFDPATATYFDFTVVFSSANANNQAACVAGVAYEMA